MKKQTVMMLAVLIVGATGFVGFKFAEPSTGATFDVEYKLDCSTCDVYFRNAEGQSEEVANVNSDWNYKFKGEAGRFAYVSAISDAGEEVKVTILQNGNRGKIEIEYYSPDDLERVFGLLLSGQ